jgi:hypothetical protein
MNETIKLRGCLEVALCNADGEVIDKLKSDNTVVTAGRAWVLKQIASGYMITSQAISHIGVGTSTTAPSSTQTALVGENTRVAITYDTAGLTASPPYWRALATLATNQGNTTLARLAEPCCLVLLSRQSTKQPRTH